MTMSVRSYCEKCHCYHPEHACADFTTSGLDIYYERLEQLNKEVEMQVISHRELEEVIRVLHRNCDPTDMTYEDHLIWEEWNKRFYPENYKEPEGESV